MTHQESRHYISEHRTSCSFCYTLKQVSRKGYTYSEHSNEWRMRGRPFYGRPIASNSRTDCREARSSSCYCVPKTCLIVRHILGGQPYGWKVLYVQQDLRYGDFGYHRNVENGIQQPLNDNLIIFVTTWWRRTLKDILYTLHSNSWKCTNTRAMVAVP
jgi:hypothetical protein